MDQTFRLRSPQTPLVRPEQTNWTYDQVNIDSTSDKSLLTVGQDHGVTEHKTVVTPEPPTFIRDELVYSKPYHLVKREGNNKKNENSGKGTDLSDHISERLQRMVMLERGHNDGRESNHSGSSDYPASTPSFMENRYPNQITK